jgi:hypothetical protein
MKYYTVYFLVYLLISSCGNTEFMEEEELIEEIQDSSVILLNEMLEAHGQLGDYEFTFRGDLYGMRETIDGFSYTKFKVTDTTQIQDLMSNEGFSRIVNDTYIELSDEDAKKYREALNSVFYFVCLPQRLEDPGVNIEVVNPTQINDQHYSVLKVTFNEEGGGTDYQDVYYYWINQSNHQMDFLAYEYNVNGGGVRFREAFNSRMIEGMRFQDYINYSAPVGTPLDSLPVLFERGELEQLSLIITEDVHPL